MKRYEGFLRGTGNEPNWPARWWIVAVELGSRTESTQGTVRTSSLVKWSAERIDCNGPLFARRSVYNGSDVRTFWRLFLGQNKPGGKLYVLSPRALMVWQTLGLWERIESGALTVIPTGPYRAEVHGDRRTFGSAGLLLTADPPSAARLLDAEGGLSFTWLCAGNFGLQPLSSGVDCMTEREELALAVKECTLLMDLYHLGWWKTTAGAMAYNGWLASYTGPPLYVSSGGGGAELEMSAIAGGLLIARPTGADPVTAYSVDCRSMYPWICCHKPQAVDLIRRDVRGEEAQEIVHRLPLACLALVEIYVDHPSYPQRSPEGVRYPVGSFTTVLCGPELGQALRLGHVRRVHRTNQYQLGFPLADYERAVWSARQSSTAPPWARAAPLIKRLGVSLVGKLLQRNEVWRECVPDINDPLWGNWTNFDWEGRQTNFMARAGITEVQIGAELAAHALPSIPLWIWSWGRIMLWDWIFKAGLDTVHYADTDGMLLSPAGYASLQEKTPISIGSWGALRLTSGPAPLVVRGPKDFTLGDRVVMAGKPLSQRRDTESLAESAWYRLPWDQLCDPGSNASWVERLR